MYQSQLRGLAQFSGEGKETTPILYSRKYNWFKQTTDCYKTLATCIRECKNSNMPCRKYHLYLHVKQFGVANNYLLTKYVSSHNKNTGEYLKF